MNTVSGCKQKTPVLDSALSLKGSSYGRRLFSMSALSLNLNHHHDDQNAVSLQGVTDDDDEDSNHNNNGFSIFHGSDRYTFSSLSSSSSGNSLGSPLWSSPCTADSSPPSVTRSLQAAVPFSWEDKPGVPNQQSIRRSSQHGDNMDSFANASNRRGSVELRPPPLYFSAGSRSPEPSQLPVFHGRHQQHPRTSSGRGAGRRPKKIDDPFLTALVECTKQGIKDDRAQKQGYSCMKTCSVRDAQITVPRSKAAFSDSDSQKDLANPDASKRRHGVNVCASSKSEWTSQAGQYGVARRQSPLTSMPSQRNQGMVYNAAHAKGNSLIRPGYYDNPDLFKAAKRDFKSTKAVNQKKQPLTFMDWISCADVELYQSLLHQ